MGHNCLQKLISHENPRMTSEQREQLIVRKGHPMTWSRYHRYGDMLRYAEFLVYSFPHLVQIETIGHSSRGLPLKVIKVSSDTENDEEKPAVWIDGGFHGRDWITSSVVTYILRQLVENYKKNRRIVDNADWYLLPVANPDGYEFSHTTDRLWSKTRANYDNSAASFATSLLYGVCEGVNMDYNFEYHWGEEGSSDDPCSDFYAGPRPSSEPETKAITDFIMSLKGRLKIYLTLHSYSQRWLLPWNYNKKEPDHDEMMSMAQKAVESLERVAGTKYNVTSNRKRAPSSGSSVEWAKGKANVKYSYRVELRDTGSYGYLLPASQILPTSKETFNAIRSLVKSTICKSS